MKSTFSFIFFSILTIGCGSNSEDSSTQPEMPGDPAAIKYSQLTIDKDSLGFGCTLITDNMHDRRADAKEIMEVGGKWPLAMRKKDETLFNAILAQGFTFREADGRLFNRADYIHDRITREESVATVQVENNVLQFFGEVALVTYRNIVKMKDADGKPETWYMSWASIFIKENGRWKIGAAHLIAERVEKN